MIFTNIFEHTIKCVAAHDLKCPIKDNFRINRIRKYSFTPDAEHLADIYVSSWSRSKLYEVNASITLPTGKDHPIAVKFIVPAVNRDKIYQFEATKDRYVGVWRITATESEPTYADINPIARLPRVPASVSNPMGDWRLRDKKVFNLASAAKMHVPVEKVVMTKADLLVDLGRASARFNQPNYDPNKEHDPAPVITNYQTDLEDAIEILMRPAYSLDWADTMEDDDEWDESAESPESLTSSAYFTESGESNSLAGSQSLPPLTADFSSKFTSSPRPYTPSPEPLSAAPHIVGGFPTGLRVQVNMSPISETPERSPGPQSPHVGPEQNSEPSPSSLSDISNFNLPDALSSRAVSPTSHAQSSERSSVDTRWLTPTVGIGSFIDGIAANPELEDADTGAEATPLLESPFPHPFQGVSLDGYITHVDQPPSGGPSTAEIELSEATSSMTSSSHSAVEDPEATTAATAEEPPQRTTPLRLFRDQFPQADRTRTTILTVKSTPRSGRLKEKFTVHEVVNEAPSSVAHAPATPLRDTDPFPAIPSSVQRQSAAVQDLMDRYRAVVDVTRTPSVDALSLPRDYSPEAPTTGTIVTEDLIVADAIPTVSTADKGEGIETKPHEAQATQPMQSAESDPLAVHKRNGSYESGAASVNTATPVSRVVHMPVRQRSDGSVVRPRGLTVESGPIITSKLSDVFGPEEIAKLNEPLSVIQKTEAVKKAAESAREEFESEPVTAIKKDKGKERAPVVAQPSPHPSDEGKNISIDTAAEATPKFDESILEAVTNSLAIPSALSWKDEVLAAVRDAVKGMADRPREGEWQQKPTSIWGLVAKLTEGEGRKKRSYTYRDASTQTSPPVPARPLRARANTTTEGTGATTVTGDADSNTTYVTHIGTFNWYNSPLPPRE